MVDNVGFGRSQFRCVGDVGQELRRGKIDDPAEAADVMAAGNLESVHGKVGKVCVGRGPRHGARGTGPWLSGLQLAARVRSSVRRPPVIGSPSPAVPSISRLARASCAEILRVKSQAGNQEERRAIRLGRDQDERGVRMSACAVESAERRLEGRAYQVAGGRRRLLRRRARPAQSSCQQTCDFPWILRLRGYSDNIMREPTRHATIYARERHKARFRTNTPQDVTL